MVLFAGHTNAKYSCRIALIASHNLIRCAPIGSSLFQETSEQCLDLYPKV